MREKFDIFLTWFFLSPLLLFYKNIRWHHKLLLIAISPFTLFSYLTYSFISNLPPLSATHRSFGEIYHVSHEFKSREDLRKITRSYIPPCDTMGAILKDGGWICTRYEKFSLKHELTPQEMEKIRKSCGDSIRWEETDSTLVYDDSPMIYAMKALHSYAYFTITIPKKGTTITLMAEPYE